MDAAGIGPVSGYGVQACPCTHRLHTGCGGYLPGGYAQADGERIEDRERGPSQSVAHPGDGEYAHKPVPQRLEAARLLSQGMSYQKIAEQTEMSTATIGRVSRCLHYGSGGYRDALNKEEVRNEILKGMGRQFDIKYAAILLSLIDDGTVEDDL